jgi:hypothetical protein
MGAANGNSRPPAKARAVRSPLNSKTPSAIAPPTNSSARAVSPSAVRACAQIPISAAA